MRTLGRLSGLIVFTPWLVWAGLATVEPVRADPAVPISECRELSIDQSGFDECLLLLAQQSENALGEIEAKWIDKLAVSEKTVLSLSLNESPADVLSDSSVAQTKGAGKLIAIVGEGAPENDETFDSTTSDADLAVQADRFAQLPVLFRQFRDQRCEWEAGLIGADRATGYQLACKISLNRQRVLQLRRLLAEKNVADTGGESFRGYYVSTASGGSFQSCDRRQDWWVTGAEEMLEALQRRYNDIAAENLEMVYVELRGRAGKAVDSGPGADFVGAVDVTTVNLMRPILEHDCRARPVRSTAPVEEVEDALTDNAFVEPDETIDTAVAKKSAITVDDLGDAGFLYGYFSNWMAACAVDQLSVCQAQTQAEYASEGEWMLAVDRSSQGDWRVRLIPTTEDHLVIGSLHLTIDGVEHSTADVAVSKMEIGRGVTVGKGQAGREVITRLRVGQSLDIEWIRPDQVSAKISFSLTGITKALQYFNQAEK